MNEGRALFQGDTEFGQWVALCQLDTADGHDRSAAMWAAANLSEQFGQWLVSANLAETHDHERAAAGERQLA